ncbi:MAG: NAD(P)-dependent oxidoreductase [Chromatiales bacterium]|jgi:3-hydroxyisobutyrate dehydrogenase-like beta-hydroxyacid dehydrogenase|nr:NAD(P)-dependent oxidoreductase [Chromatiales bacterium]
MSLKVGFIGLGNMGKPMAINLAEAGFSMAVLDLNPEPVAELVALGAASAATPRELAGVSDVVVSVVMNDRQTLQVLLEGDGDGVLAGARPGTLIIIASTVSVETCQVVAQAAAGKDVQVIDAAVSGAAERSRDGTLSLIVGGDDDAVERAKPLFDVVGSNVYHMGELGMGQVAKACNNLMCLVGVHVVEEALRLASAAGIEEDRMLEVARASSGDSWTLRNIANLRELAAIHTHGDVDMSIFGRKDIALASKLGGKLGASIPITDFVFEQTKK